ncbi:hypothetical protein D9758_013209 [Tetrapyrgos nigripes]|uniref:Glucose-methanol-choline oxidoreductase N-terminal domain-containing protein n=1 Tax=Tetrapyrgos nigripes TaxID=182062 RepID=A0A8H5CRF4_9AGAR|nr:hypothetical protein D9758_013209 [Tetrapyrgos nigripes]
MIIKNDRFSVSSTSTSTSKAQGAAGAASSKSKDEEAPPPAYEAVANEDFQFVRPQPQPQARPPFLSAHSAPTPNTRSRTISSTSQSTQVTQASTLFDQFSSSSASSVGVPTATHATQSYHDRDPSHFLQPALSPLRSPSSSNFQSNANSPPLPPRPSRTRTAEREPLHPSSSTMALSSLSPTGSYSSSAPSTASAETGTPSLSTQPQPVFTPKKRTLGFGPNIEKQAREFIIGHINDLVRQTYRYTLDDCRSVLRGCEEACRTVGEVGGKQSLSLSDVLQEKLVDDHTPFYWSIIHRPSHTRTHEKGDLIPDLLSALLEFAELVESTRADIRHACLMVNDQELFQDIRVRYASTSTSKGSGLPLVDRVVVQEIPGSEPVFCVDFEIEGFLERMETGASKDKGKKKDKSEEEKGVEVEFIAHRRAWLLHFERSSSSSSKKSASVSDPWDLSITLLEKSAPTYLDSQFSVFECNSGSLALEVPPDLLLKDGYGPGKRHLVSPSMPNLRAQAATAGLAMATMGMGAVSGAASTSTIGRAKGKNPLDFNAGASTLHLATLTQNASLPNLTTRLKSSSMLVTGKKEITVCLDAEAKDGAEGGGEGGGIGHALRLSVGPYFPRYIHYFCNWNEQISASYSASLYTDPNDVPTKEYDFIVVGAGTAGNVIATRLSEDPTKSVLVIEAGLDDTGILPIQVPFLAFNNDRTIVDWNYTTVPQKGLNNRTFNVQRGFALGGTSSFNLMVWTRGSRDLWDHYADVTGDSGWSWDALEKYWNKAKCSQISTLVPPISNPAVPPPPPNDPTLSNGKGPILVTRANSPTELDAKVINTSMLLQQEDSRFKYTVDMNTGDSIGFGYAQETNGNGVRSSSATAYLHPALNSNRSNLDVLIQTRAMRLLESDNTTSKSYGRSSVPHFSQVEVAQSVDGPRFKFSARNEIILSSGAIGTPQLLLLSGVGPKDELKELGIDVIAERPAVGKNLRDHPLLLTIYNVNSNQTFDDLTRNPALQAQTFGQWQTNRTGLFANSPGSVLGFTRLPEDQLEGVQDSASGPHAPHLEMVFVDGFLNHFGPLPDEGHFISVLNVVVAPQSVGSLTLASAEGGTFTLPLIDYNIYGNDFDIQAMLQAVNDTETFLSTAPWTQDNFIISVAGRNSTSIGGTEEEKIAFMRDNTNTIFNPVGTAKMGRKQEDVTNSRLLVRGVKGVRVVDASVFPTIPECHLQAVVYTLAERAADIIKEDHGML